MPQVTSYKILILIPFIHNEKYYIPRSRNLQKSSLFPFSTFIGFLLSPILKVVYSKPMIEETSLKAAILGMFISFIMSIVIIISLSLLCFSCRKGISLFFRQKFNADIISLLISVSVSDEKDRLFSL